MLTWRKKDFGFSTPDHCSCHFLPFKETEEALYEYFLVKIAMSVGFGPSYWFQTTPKSPDSFRRTFGRLGRACYWVRTRRRRRRREEEKKIRRSEEEDVKKKTKKKRRRREVKKKIRTEEGKKKRSEEEEEEEEKNRKRKKEEKKKKEDEEGGFSFLWI